MKEIRIYWKSCSCGKKPIHQEIIPTMGEDIIIRFCQKCWDEKQENERIHREERANETKKSQIEFEKQKRYEYLKREIELVELEKKAKELGIE